MRIPIYEVSKDITFSGAHQIRFHGGKCERLHGHNWLVRVHVRTSELDRIGMVVDFADLQRILTEACAPFDHQNLNEVPPFDTLNTTAENLAQHLYGEVSRKLAALTGERVRVSRVEVWENQGSLATYRED